MILALVPVLALLAAVVWRWVDGPLAMVASAVAVGVAVCVAFYRIPAAWLLFLLSCLGAVITVVGMFEFAWPCEVSCSTGEQYSRLFDAPLLAWSLLGFLAVAMLALADARRRRLRSITQGGAWAMVGGSLYYLGLSVQLEMVCSHCLSVHTTVLCFLAVLLAAGKKACFGLPVALVVAVGLHTAYHPDWLSAPQTPQSGTTGTAETSDPGADPPANPDADPNVSPTAALTDAERELLNLADASRRLGSGDAPLRLEFVHAFTCKHCAEKHGPTLRTLQEVCSQGGVQLVMRHFVPLGTVEGRQLLDLTFAAGIQGDYEAFAAAAFRAQKLKDNLDWRSSMIERLIKALAKLIDLKPLLASIDEHPRVFEELRALEGSTIRDLQVQGELPQVFLIDNATGEVLKRWESHDFQPFLARASVIRILGERAKEDGP